MHNARFMIRNMEQHRREDAHRHRHDWKRPPESKPKSLIRRAVAALRQ